MRAECWTNNKKLPWNRLHRAKRVIRVRVNRFLLFRSCCTKTRTKVILLSLVKSLVYCVFFSLLLLQLIWCVSQHTSSLLSTFAATIVVWIVGCMCVSLTLFHIDVLFFSFIYTIFFICFALFIASFHFSHEVCSILIISFVQLLWLSFSFASHGIQHRRCCGRHYH